MHDKPTNTTHPRAYTERQRLDWFQLAGVGSIVRLEPKRFGSEARGVETYANVVKATDARLTLDALDQWGKPIVVDRKSAALHGSYLHDPHPFDYDLAAADHAADLKRRLMRSGMSVGRFCFASPELDRLVRQVEVELNRMQEITDAR